MNSEQVIQEILERLTRIETKLDDYNKVREKIDNANSQLQIHEEKIKHVEGRVSNIEANNKWLWRTVVGAIITLLMSIIATFIKK
ncbi:protein of unknown function DUF1267 [Caldicellulosiruptor hydrothermalis 108]|uniref:Hemolysin XhlA n=1 Tax=Caldicellulosiruptor hydrothermalis (strain DSM 18901 / VKM B-2411 / 108) TaxID=632292 RepID=E4QE31_CALH1|nr:hemolysin XhlA family protein [Caldicellulosiruptor hydrothermalis]ADQ06525.1 protein of unknown function DUF1267 [Caldicellulosiruptor hydrothermalis 108]